jgi:hypothetical protein
MPAPRAAHLSGSDNYPRARRVQVEGSDLAEDGTGPQDTLLSSSDQRPKIEALR